MFKTQLLVRTIILAGLLIGLLSACANQPAIASHGRTVFVTGDQAPEAGGNAVFEGHLYGHAVINNSGKVAFFATLKVGTGGVSNSNDSGIWAEGPGGLKLVAREGSPAPGTVGGVFKDLLPAAGPVFNDQGKVAFAGFLLVDTGDVTDSNDRGLWAGGVGSLSLVAREGTQAPGLPSGAVFDVVGHPRINDAGKVAFGAGVRGTGVIQYNDSGIWSDVTGPLSLVAREGGPAPGFGGLTFATSFSDAPPLLSNAGHVTFKANLGGSIPKMNYGGIWSTRGGSLASILFDGNPAPGTSGALFDDFFSLSANNSSKITIFASLQAGTGGVTSSNDRGIWAEKSGGLTLIAREGDQAPGTPTGVVFSFDNALVKLSDAGQVAFVGSLRHGAGGVTVSNDQGIWVEKSGGLFLVAREGSHAPGTPASAVFDYFEGIGGTLTMNTLGQVVFHAFLRKGVGGVDDSNNEGIWALTPQGNLVLVVREGNPLQVAAGDIRQVGERLNVVEYSGGGDGYERALSNSNELVFAATFSDGSHGVFVTEIQPEMISFVIKSYQVFEEAGANQTVKVYLNDDTGKYRGYIEFIENYSGTQKFVVHPNGIINAFMPFSRLQPTLDILRNEKPVSFLVNQQYNWAALRTAYEPTGEEESGN